MEPFLVFTFAFCIGYLNWHSFRRVCIKQKQVVKVLAGFANGTQCK
ncbi:hypothetical protein N482_04520 [Pseudoalteromonas luteoviolacea NCIMB 1942]|uniref:Uncharacterized protein n=1 Tax=Pseudoalteromonas luteoviolacea NCIMB 1942 TaxID=1365253 RepID=A0A167H913_9GAMM|nr:hypothetical protein N482_04520 [Pseudoalteromonas luteoviolacea NCIMB 1942]